jgi:arabinofuranan 3-O-arabinosyltransferase
MSSPGKMPADTKLYLYLDPRRLVSDSIWSFDARQFAGWVPHQVIAYLWPSGPWYVAAQAIGLPDWVAHRLCIGTIMLAAVTGIAWAVRRRLGFGLAAVTAGLVYQLSPYLVPCVSRTSMLLPWAGLGCARPHDQRGDPTQWRDAAPGAGSPPPVR